MALRVVVIGGVALGPKVAARCKRVNAEADVTLIDQSNRISYGGCGIPYFVSGEVNRIEDLQTTSYGTVRDTEFFKTHKGITAIVDSRVTSIDREKKIISLKNLSSGSVSTLPYDKLVLALGSKAFQPSIPGFDLEGVSAATTLDEAEAIRNRVATGKVNSAVVVGGGFIGIEMAVALADMWGIPVSLIELAPQLMQGFLSPTLACMATRDLEKHNVTVFCNEKVTSFEGENSQVCRVVTDKRTLDADLVVMAAGITPNTDIAKQAGLETTAKGLLIVNEYMQTSDPNIYSGGDCVTIKDLVTNQPSWFPLGSMANRQGRVIGTNVAGGKATFSGAVGAWGVKLFEQNIAGAGLTITKAESMGFDAINVHVEQVDKAHFYPEKSLVGIELVVEKSTRRVLGIQGISAGGDALAARINAVAPLLSRGCVIEDISNLEVLYSPPFASAMDIINVAGNVAENILEGRLVPISPLEFESLWLDRHNNNVSFIDTRVARDSAPEREKHPNSWKNIPQDTINDHLSEIPKDKPVVLICNTGLRSSEAQLMLLANGYVNTKSVMGGLSSVKRMSVDI